jgi:pimeloyl-ACP methyl ester carboxylesterase
MSDGADRGAELEVSWPLDDTVVYGTVALPPGPGPFPAVVMVAGSGPTDRDWNSPMIPGDNGSARLLAAALAARGFASIRYDKRAAGPRAAETLERLVGKISIQSHLDELTGAAHAIAGQGSVDAGRLFALANSEGALHALNYQIRDPAIPFAGLVLASPPGRPMGAVARAQIAAQLNAIPQAAPNVARIMAAYDAAIERFVAGLPIQSNPALPPSMQAVLESLASPINLPFARELWTADVAALLARVRIPVLVVIGKKDIQVSWQADGGRLREMASGSNVTFLFPEHANHVLKHEPTPLAELTPATALERYSGPASELDPEALSGILAWLEARLPAPMPRGGDDR